MVWVRPHEGREFAEHAEIEGAALREHPSEPGALRRRHLPAQTDAVAAEAKAIATRPAAVLIRAGRVGRRHVCRHGYAKPVGVWAGGGPFGVLAGWIVVAWCQQKGGW